MQQHRLSIISFTSLLSFLLFTNSNYACLYSQSFQIGQGILLSLARVSGIRVNREPNKQRRYTGTERGNILVLFFSKFRRGFSHFGRSLELLGRNCVVVWINFLFCFFPATCDNPWYEVSFAILQFSLGQRTQSTVSPFNCPWRFNSQEQLVPIYFTCISDLMVIMNPCGVSFMSRRLVTSFS